MLRRVAPLVPAVLIGRIPASAALSVRPDRGLPDAWCDLQTCTSYHESKPIKHQVTIHISRSVVPFTIDADIIDGQSEVPLSQM